MISSSDRQLHSYAIGEDVVVRLEGVEVFDLRKLQVVPPAYMPPWTIAQVRALVTGLGSPAYLFRGRMCGSHCIWVAEESLVEGVA